MRENNYITDNQVAFEYAIYMMVGSYFQKTVCKTDWQEKKLYIHYKEQKESKQYIMEDVVIRYVEKELLEKLPKGIWKETMQVHLVGRENGTQTEIQFWGDKYLLRVMGDFQGKKNSRIDYRLSAKTGGPYSYI